MKIEQRKLAALNSVYSCNSIEVDGQTRILLASEAEDRCLAWNGPDYTESHTVWDGPGGTMSIVPIPGTKRIGYLDENIAALDIHLTEDDRARIDAIFPPDAAAGTRYPAAGMSALNR